MVSNGVAGGAPPVRLSKSARRRAKKKAQKDEPTEAHGAAARAAPPSAPPPPPEDVEVVVEPLADASSLDPSMRAYFAEVLGHFVPREEDPEGGEAEETNDKGEVMWSEDEDNVPGWGEEAPAPLSKRKAKKLQRLTVGELKQRVSRPEVVEGWDVDAADPRLLVHLKSCHNSIPVPEHWKFKRDYLSTKRGMEKPPFQLPSYIAATGIAEMKDSLREKEAEQTLKAQTRARVQPKIGKVEVDYQALHDAFFKFQVPPRLTAFGDVYFEGKEFQTQRNRDARPGRLSSALREALNIPPGAPPPWLYAMQRVGLPPSYPYLRIPGLNAPLPPGASWGVNPGEWGYPPTDGYGRPVYPDVTNTPVAPTGADDGLPAEEREHWGELGPEEEAEESEEESEEEEEEEDEEEGADQEEQEQEQDQPEVSEAGDAGAQYYTEDGLQSTLPGAEGGIQLRKSGRPIPGIPEPPPQPTGPRQLYTVVQEQEADHSGFLATGRQYDLASAMAPAQPAQPPAHAAPLPLSGAGTRKRGRDDVVVSGDAIEGASQADLAAEYARGNHLGPTAPGADDAQAMQMLREDLARKRHESEARRRTGGRRG